MKKIFALVLILFILTGCGALRKEFKGNKIKSEYSLTSTADRLVFKKDDNYEVVYYEDDKIVKVESAIKFESPALAEEYYLKENYGNNDNIKVVYDTFILEQLDDYFEDYKDLSRQELIEYMRNADFEKK